MWVCGGVVIYQRVIYNSDQALSFVLLYVSTSRPDNLLQINVVSGPKMMPLGFPENKSSSHCNVATSSSDRTESLF